MRFQQIDQFASELKADKRASVYQSTKGTHEKRTKLLFDEYAEPDHLREIAGQIKQHAIENLDTYLPAVEAKMKANGVQVHWASTAEAANQAVLGIMRARGATKMVKAKTMVSEETELAHFLEKHGIEVLIIPWPTPRKRLLRISAQLYNSLPQYERLAHALVELLP